MAKTPENAPADEQREKFLAALEAKKAHTHSGQSHADGGTQGKDHANRSGGKREFRRKAGG
jgi:hypothetical protein